MRAFVGLYVRFLCVLPLIVVTLTGSYLPAFAQGTESTGQLERVEVAPPERRAAPRSVPNAPSDGDQDQFSAEEPQTGGAASSRGASSIEGVPASTMALVEGKSQVSLASTSLPSQVSVVTSEDIQRLNIKNFADLFRRILGTKIFGRGEMGHPIGMRGYQGTYGTDTAVFIDGVPQNFPSAGQGGTGMSDIAWLNADVIERIEVIKGPFSAMYGDFAMAGVINIVTKASQPTPSLSFEGGSFGSFRAFGVFSRTGWIPTPYLANEYTSIDGYRGNEQYRRLRLFNKISTPFWGGILSLRHSYYQSVYGWGGNLRIDEVRKGLVGRRHAVNPFDGGEQSRWMAVMNYAPVSGERGLYATLYADSYDKIRFSTTLPQPQLAMGDDRFYWGGRAYYNIVFGEVGSLTVGGETRQDSGEAFRYNTYNNRDRKKDTLDNGLRLSSWAWFVQSQIKPAESLKIVGGLRGDYFAVDTDNKIRPENSGIGFPSIVCPKIGLVITPKENFNIFGNVGRGLRSPAADDMSPATAGVIKNFDLQPSPVDSADVGFNAILFENLYIAADYYHTIQQQEIKVVNNQPVNIGDTLRKGYEVEAKYYTSDGVSIFANYAWVDARVTNPTTPGQVLVTGVSEHIIKGGIDIIKQIGDEGRVIFDAYYQYLSGAPYYSSSGADRAVPIMGPDYDAYNLKLSYEGQGWSSFFSGQYIPREFSSERMVVQPSSRYLTYDPQPKWDFNAGLTYNFW